MKKILTSIMAIAFVSMFSAAYAQEFILDGKLGTAYAKDPAKFGFNAGIEAGVGVNKYLEILAMPGFTWFNWDEKLGITKQEGTLTSELKSTVNGYMFPVLAGAKIKIADAKESIGIVPYILAGAGYTWMNYSYSTPAYTDTYGDSYPKESGSGLYKGFTWLALAGFSYQFPDTNMSLGLEGGYRFAKLDKNSYTVDMSGWVINVGLSFAIGGSQD